MDVSPRAPPFNVVVVTSIQGTIISTTTLKWGKGDFFQDMSPRLQNTLAIGSHKDDDDVAIAEIALSEKYFLYPGVKLVCPHCALRITPISLFLILSTCRMSDHGDSHVSVNHLSVCYPDLLSHRCSSQLCGSIGHLIVFKQNHYKGRDQTKSMQDQEDSTLVKWVVIVPGKIEIIVARIKCLISLAVFKLH